ncbi:DUF1329 domain-containing protein [Zavarzinia compransoris]|uniref:DUF1329 domain-containing protein n=1 Tax=Zavarzinia marina TaxID=2911065 RepID=UPI001F412EF0|nr:DUF1329 domain-containing protein [Zavarzinia marina]MCF4166491.1 DUF1329 domain-containing protein [Zavarzinia marina]
MRAAAAAFIGVISCLTATAATAKVTPEQAARLDGDLTPMGAERAGNAAGTIPPWEGGVTRPPATYRPGMHYPTPFPEDKPLFTITGQNAAQYQANLTPGQMALLKLYPTYVLPVYQSRRSCALPERLYEGNRRNALTATMTEDQNGLNDALLGNPFPIPNSGVEAIWNHRLRYRGFKVKRYFAAALVARDGSYELVRGHDQGIAHYNGPGINQIGDVSDIGQLNNIAISYLNFITYPPKSAGTIVLVLDTINAKELPRQAWVYNPGTRRLLRAPEIAYDNPAPQTDGLAPADTFDMYNGATDRYRFELQGKREIYMGYNNYEIADEKYSYKDILTPNHMRQDLMRYELHRAWVVDSKLKEGSRHVYGRRTFYLDEDSWNITLVDVYDTRGVLWRVQDGPLSNAYDVPLCSSVAEIAHDLQSGKYLTFGMKNEEKMFEFDADLDASEFTPQAVRRMGSQ